jgi:hypothetical protein
MNIPSFVIILPCLACFLLCALRYYQADPVNRLTDRRFVTGCAAVLTIIIYLLARIAWPDGDMLPMAFLLLALGLLCYAVRLFRGPLHPPEAASPAPTTG